MAIQRNLESKKPSGKRRWNKLTVFQELSKATEIKTFCISIWIEKIDQWARIDSSSGVTYICQLISTNFQDNIEKKSFQQIMLKQPDKQIGKNELHHLPHTVHQN